MTRTYWLIGIAVLLAGGAVLVGVLSNRGGESQADARQAFCSSVSALQESIGGLTDLSPASASKSDYQSALDTIQSDWDSVTSDASDLVGITTSQLDDAWDSFEDSVDDVSDDASVSDALGDIKSATQALASSVASTLSGPDCS